MRVVRVSSDEIVHPAPVTGDARPTPDGDEYPLVLVAWHDAFFDFDQAGPDDFRPDYLVRTVGFLIGDGPRFLSIAQEVLPDGDGFRAVTHIPVSIVESVVPLDRGPATTPSGGVG